MATPRENTSHQDSVINVDLFGSLTLTITINIIMKKDMNLRTTATPHSVDIMIEQAILQQINVRDAALIAGIGGTACDFVTN